MKSPSSSVPGSFQFPTYRTEERRQELLRLGLSPPVVRLALFDLPHWLFRTRCDDLGPPLPEWRHHQPRGTPVTWLWCTRHYHQLVTGVRARGWRWLRSLTRLRPPGSRLEFILFRPDALDVGHVVVAYSEQGLLASVFSGMIADAEQLHEVPIDLSADTPFPREECEAMIMEQLRAAAESVGFQRLTEVHAFRRQYGDREDYHDLLYDYTRSIP
jgi:hypothetical protein